MNRPDTSVAATFLRIGQGGSEAFKDLFILYYDRLFTTAIQYCKAEAIAEDIVQEIFFHIPWQS